MIMFLDGVLAVGCVPFLGTPDKGCDDPMVVVSTKEVIKEIVLNADAMIREQGALEDDPLDRMKTLSKMIENKGYALTSQFTCLETASRHAKDLSSDELDSYENVLTSILKNILEAKCNVASLRNNIGRSRR